MNIRHIHLPASKTIDYYREEKLRYEKKHSVFLIGMKSYQKNLIVIGYTSIVCIFGRLAVSRPITFDTVLLTLVIGNSYS